MRLRWREVTATPTRAATRDASNGGAADGGGSQSSRLRELNVRNRARYGDALDPQGAARALADLSNKIQSLAQLAARLRVRYGL